MRAGIAMLVALAGCSVPPRVALYPGGPEIDNPSSSPIVCPAGTTAKRTKRPAPGTLKSAIEWCELPDGTKHGPYIDYEGRATTRVHGTYDHGKRVGMWTAIKEMMLWGMGNVVIVKTARWADGQPDGETWVFATCETRDEHSFYSYNGCSTEQQTLSRGSFKAGRRHGRWEWFGADSPPQPVLVAEFEDGAHHGQMILYNREGRPSLEGRWDHDNPDGLWKVYRDDGSVEAEGPYAVDRLKLEEKTWPMDSVPPDRFDFVVDSFNRDNAAKYRRILVKEGDFTEWDADGNKLVGQYHEGDREGEWVTYDSAGRIRVRAEYRYGKMSGRYQELDETGRLRVEGSYEGGDRHGEWKTWHPGGQLATAGSYLVGRKEGVWVEKSPDGAVISRDNYVDGKKVDE